MSKILEDSRFTKLLNDPKYRQIPKHERKVKIDKRFKSMFNDDKFKVKYSVDKRGRPINETSSENLRRYYDLNSDESEDSDEENVSKSEGPGDETEKSGAFVKKKHTGSTDDEEDKNFSEPLKNDKLVRGQLDNSITAKLLDLEVDYARGEGFLQTDSSSDENSSDETEDSDLEHEWGELDADAETTETSTSRLAVCNMDWDNMKAVDIMVLFNSFLPPGRTIHKISIYPSKYGKQRMQEEELRGPIELTEHKKNEDKFDDQDDDDNSNEEGSSYHMEKLRRYQLNRLKYYYAVVECDKVSTADKLYSECDGMEYESSATKLDLRFIPDNESFDEESKDVCEKLPDLVRYKPRLFTTTALQQAKVELTWDTTNPNRTELIKNALEGDVNDADLKDYLASSTDESDGEHSNHQHNDEEDDDDPIKKYKNLLKEIDEKEDKKKDFEMELTWDLGVKEKAEELVQKKITQGATDMTPFEKLIEKRKEKKKMKKVQRLEKIKSDQSVDNLGSGSSEDDDIPSDVDMNDPYFAEEFNKPEFKKKKNKESKNQSGDGSADEGALKKKAALQLLLDDEDDGKAHFSLKKIQDMENANSKKSRRKKKLREKMNESKTTLPDFEINVDDQRFSALFNSHHYNIDPTNPNFKKTRNMEKLIQEKLKRRPAESGANEAPLSKKSKEAAELSVLIKNIKRKTTGTMNVL